MLLAAFTRLWGLGAQSLWMDEAFSHLFATLPPGMAWETMAVDAVHPPLYYLLLRPWLALGGGSELALRFPSAVAGVLTVAILYRAERHWLGRRTAGWAPLLLALNPYHVWYSQEARMYALLGLLALVVLVVFWRALGSRRTRAWGVLVGVSALAYLTHYFALYLPLVEFAFLLATFRRHHRALARWTVAQALAVLPLATWLAALYSTGGGTFGIGWIPKPRPSDLLRTLWSFGMAYDGRVTPLVVAGLVAWGGLLALGVWRGCASKEARTLLILALALPLLGTFLLSLRRPTYVDRFFVGCLPAFLLLAAAGLACLPWWTRWAVGLVLVVLGLWGTARFHNDPLFIKEDWHGAAAYVEAQEMAGDVLALRQFQYVVPFCHYYRGALEPAAVTLNRRTTPLQEIAAGHERLWLIRRACHDDLHHLAWSEPLVLKRDETEPVVQAWLVEHHPRQAVAFPGLHVVLFDVGGDS
jgi:mannosyltransferase